jgi:hypothetical protein
MYMAIIDVSNGNWLVHEFAFPIVVVSNLNHHLSYLKMKSFSEMLAIK